MKELLILYSFFIPALLFCQVEEATLLSNWQDTSIIGSTNHTNVYNEIWGYAIKEHEYAIIGTTAGTHFIDISNPNTPFEAHFVPGADQGGEIVHRDYHDYKGYLYAVAGEGQSTLQIIDMQSLPEKVTVVYNSAQSIRVSHNIFIDTAASKLYALATNSLQLGYAAMRTFDLSNPVLPVHISDFNEFGGIRPSHVHDAFVKDNIAFLNLGNDGLAVVDFSDPRNPKTLSTLTSYPDRGYNHSGWLSSQGYYYMADENHGLDLKILDVNDLCELEVVGTFNANVDNLMSITHNQVVACDYLYVAYYYDGLRVYDITDPISPKLVRFFDTYPLPDGGQYRGAWGVYPFLPSGNILLSDMQSGLFVFEGMGDNCIGQSREDNSLQSCTTTPTNDFFLPNQIALSPNPAIDQLLLTLNLSKTAFRLHFSLVDINGKVVQHRFFPNIPAGKNDFLIALNENLPQGLYFFSLQNEKFQLTEKLLIEKRD